MTNNKNPIKYVCFDNGAIEEMISGRLYQSTNFSEGEKLIGVLAGRITLSSMMGKVIITRDEDSLFFSTSGEKKHKKFLIVDAETSHLFTELLESETLISIQKLMRFCSKLWSAENFSSSEHIVPDSSKAVILPLPFSNGSYGDSFQLSIERDPDKIRMKKRHQTGKFVLVYKTSKHKELITNDIADVTNFRKCFAKIDELYSSVDSRIQEFQLRSVDDVMTFTELNSEQISTRKASHLKFNDWINLLTRQQIDFVMKDTSSPHRLQGAAGTGKTLALLIRTIAVLKRAENESEKCRALFVTHSEATKNSIIESLTTLDEDQFYMRSNDDDVVLNIETLASLCAKTLKQNINEDEFIDKDAQDSKLLQHMYIEEAIEYSFKNDFKSHEKLLSEEFRDFFKSQSKVEMAPLFQHEISVLIKGRANEEFEKYSKLPSLKYGLPVQNSADKGFVFNVFKIYQDQLEISDQFDTDDVVLSAIGQLNTPIWRRRRTNEGYNFIAIDETHLFNINELHVFHYFTQKIGHYPISFSVDQAQGVGDRGWSEISEFNTLFDTEGVKDDAIKMDAVFRSSPQILNFSTSILASGATLFTNFENTLNGSQSVFTSNDERRAKPVFYVECTSDENMIEMAFSRLEKLAASTSAKKWEMLITTLSDDLCKKMVEYAKNKNKPISVLKKRGDFHQLEQAKRSGHYMVGHVDYVGGLQFDVVIVVGVDKGRVPYIGGQKRNQSTYNYSSYAAHNRLYVASSRAKIALEILGVKERGPSELLAAAFDKNLIIKA